MVLWWRLEYKNASKEALMKRPLLVGAGFLAVLTALGVGQSVLEKAAHAQASKATQAPRFEVDPFWPKPLPNHWLLGNTIGLHVDEQDNVWIIHRGAANLNNDERGIDNKIYECCTGAPPVLVFDKAG